jgi:phage gp36-like protein
MAFIDTTDFEATVHTEILNALTQNNDVVINDNVARSIDEVKAYLNGRYDTANIFNKEGDARNKYILRICLTICVYYIYLTHNPRKLTQVVVDEFNRALHTLEKIQAGKINPEGLPVPVEPDQTSNGLSQTGESMQWGSSDQVGSDW